MNWYKTAQQLELDTKPEGGYLSVGHDIYKNLNTNYYGYKPNYMWKWVDGKVEVEEETEENTGHASFPRWLGGQETYIGRYDGKSGIISIVAPSSGMSQYRGIPKSIQYQLRMAFPEATKIAVF